MKDKVSKLIRKSKLLLIISIVISVLLVATVIPGIVYPKFESWREKAAQNKREQEKQRKVVQNIAVINSVDKFKLKEYSKLLEDVLPLEADTLRVLSIFESVNGYTGMTLDKYEISGENGDTTKTVIPGKTVPAAPAAQPGTPAKAGSQTAVQTQKDYKISATYHGNLKNALKLIDLIGNIKRAIAIESITISQGTATEKPLVTVEMSMPLGQKSTSVTAETQMVFTRGNRETLDELLASLTIDASPSSENLGKSNF